MRRRARLPLLAAAWLVPGLLAGAAAQARSFDAIRESGSIALCAHPNALPFASKKGSPPGFQVELAEAIAERLGVKLARHWVTNGYERFRAGCDIVLDAVADRAAMGETGLRPSRPYQRGGVVLATRSGETTPGALADYVGEHRIGVMVGSLAAMILDKQRVATRPFVFEDEMLNALADHSVDAIVVSRASAGYYNLTHAAAPLQLVDAFAGEPDLNWNLAVGMQRPDDALRQHVDAALEALLADGTIARIYERYGVAALPP
jgi:polar amino acid transport system substrate-binding protein